MVRWEEWIRVWIGFSGKGLGRVGLGRSWAGLMIGPWVDGFWIKYIYGYSIYIYIYMYRVDYIFNFN